MKKIAAIDLAGPKGQRFDYLTVDEDDHYLLSAHLGPGILYVIDLRTNALGKAIPGGPRNHESRIRPGLRKIYTSDCGENKLGVVDLRSISMVKRLPTAAKPNRSVYAPPFKKLYVSDTDGLGVAVVDVEKDAITKTLHFNSETGMPQYDSGTRKVWANLRRINKSLRSPPAVSILPVPSSPWQTAQYSLKSRRASIITSVLPVKGFSAVVEDERIDCASPKFAMEYSKLLGLCRALSPCGFNQRKAVAAVKAKIATTVPATASPGARHSWGRVACGGSVSINLRHLSKAEGRPGDPNALWVGLWRVPYGEADAIAFHGAKNLERVRAALAGAKNAGLALPGRSFDPD